MLNNEGEEWKDIVGCEGIYKVSNQGRVKRLKVIRTMRNQVTSWEQEFDEYIFKPCNDTRGYPQVLLTMGENKRVARVHRLVAEAFLPEPSFDLKETCKLAGLDYVLINHKDNNPMNNLWTNLEWCSPKFNCDWCVVSGTHNIETIKGSKNYNSTLTEENVSDIVKLLKSKFLSQQEIAEIYGVKQITISNIWTGRSWSWYTGIPWKARTRKNKKISASIAES